MAAGGRRVVVVGDVMTDVVAVLDRELRPDTDTPGRVRTQGGGSAANTAHWLGASAVAVTYVGRVGDDGLGRAACAALTAAGVELEVGIDAAVPSGTCVVIVAPDGGRTMVPDPGANTTLRREHVPDRLLRAGDHLHLSGYSLLRPETRSTALALLTDAHAAGMSTSVDVASAGPIADVGAAEVRRWLVGVDLVLANDDEAAALTPGGPTGSAARATALARELSATVVVKRGADGVVAAVPDGTTVQRPAVPVTVVDSIGAGDAFAAGLLPRWEPTGDPDRLASALEAALALAARAVSQVGARPAPEKRAHPG